MLNLYEIRFYQSNPQIKTLTATNLSNNNMRKLVTCYNKFLPQGSVIESYFQLVNTIQLKVFAPLKAVAHHGGKIFLSVWSFCRSLTKLNRLLRKEMNLKHSPGSLVSEHLKKLFNLVLRCQLIKILRGNSRIYFLWKNQHICYA